MRQGTTRPGHRVSSSFVAFLIVALLASVVGTDVRTADASTKKVAPLVTVTIHKSAVGPSGGAITVRASVRMPSAQGRAVCRWSTKPTTPRFSGTVKCGKAIARIVRLPANTSTIPRVYKIMLSVGRIVESRLVTESGKPMSSSAPTTTTTVPSVSPTTTTVATTPTPAFTADSAPSPAAVGVAYS